ncbi:MAG: hypothetical protein ACI90U_003079 [Pseudomonadales bacterium]|jgi:hypothetical protein
MKRFSFLIAVSFVLAVTGCGGGGGSNSASTTTPVADAPVADTPAFKLPSSLVILETTD